MFDIEACSSCGEPFEVQETASGNQSAREPEPVKCPHCGHTEREEKTGGWWQTSKVSPAEREKWFAAHPRNRHRRLADGSVDPEISPNVLKYDATDEQLVRRLGAAVVWQWDNLPTEAQKRILDQARHMSDRDVTVQLDFALADFIARHKPV